MSTIEVYADMGCPFTHVGLLRFVAARAARGRDDVLLRVHAWPLEIVNGTPLDPAFIAEEIDEIRGQLDDDVFVGFDEDAFPGTSIPAMALVATAYDLDDAVGEAVSLRLRELLFEEGTDVADPEVLSGVASGSSLPFDPIDATGHRDRVLADHAAGVERGVVGSPHFFTPGGGFFCPALDVGRDDDGHLRIHADPEGFDAFLAACFA